MQKLLGNQAHTFPLQIEPKSKTKTLLKEQELNSPWNYFALRFGLNKMNQNYHIGTVQGVNAITTQDPSLKYADVSTESSLA